MNKEKEEGSLIPPFKKEEWTEERKNELKKMVDTLEDKLDGEIGNHWWKIYIASAFWSNISTPINLSITLLSAVSAGQATTQNMISKNMFMKVSIASLLISTLNTFFRPHQQFTQNMDIMRKINEYGFEFEDIYYSSKSTFEDSYRRYHSYRNLMIRYHKYRNLISPDQQNYFTDLIYYICLNSCLINYDKWLDIDAKHMEHDNKLKSSCIKLPDKAENEKEGDIENQIKDKENENENKSSIELTRRGKGLELLQKNDLVSSTSSS